MPEDTDTLVLGGIALLALWMGFQALGGPGRDVGGAIGGVVNGAGQVINDTFGGAADVVDSLNPFTEGPILGWI